jgi:hypothetical protein
MLKSVLLAVAICVAFGSGSSFAQQTIKQPGGGCEKWCRETRCTPQNAYGSVSGCMTECVAKCRIYWSSKKSK